MRVYYRWVDTAKGIGIILVVLGHALSDTMLGDRGSIAARMLFDFIYSFHMPLFFFLAGFCGAKVLDIDSVHEKKNYIISRFKRLMVPYFFVGLLYVPLKILMSSEVHTSVDLKTLPVNFIEGMNPNFQLWTLYALFLIASLLCVFAYPGRTYKRLALILTGEICVLSMLSTCPIHIIQEVMGEGFFYVLGAAYRKDGRRERLSWKIVILTTSVFFLANVAKEWSGLSVIMLITSISGIITVCELAKHLKKGNTLILSMIGRYSMDIYIIANVVQVLIRSICLNKIHLPGVVCCVLSTLFGIALPILISKYLIRKIIITRMLVLGDFARS